MGRLGWNGQLGGVSLAWRNPHRPLMGRGSFSLIALDIGNAAPLPVLHKAWDWPALLGLCSMADALHGLGKGPLPPGAFVSPAQGSS